MAYTDCTGYKRLAFLATWIPSWALTLNKHERTERIYLLGVRSLWRHRVSGLKSISEGDFIEPKKLQLAPTTYSLSLSPSSSDFLAGPWGMAKNTNDCICLPINHMLE